MQLMRGDDCIVKLFAPDELVEKIDHWVAQSDNEIEEGRLILLADDSQTVRDLNKYILEDAGFTVETYETGLKIFVDLGNHQPCLIILDVKIPELDGYETCEKICSEFPQLKFPILFFTSAQTQEDIRRVTEVGGNEYVSKSLAAEVLVERVKPGPKSK